MYSVERVNQTNYANIYCLYDSSGKAQGTKEVVLAGRDVGTHYYTLGALPRKQVRDLFAKHGKAESEVA